MSTYGTLLSDVLDDLDRDDITAQAQTAINAAIDHYEHEPWWFTEVRATTSTTDGDEYVELPDNFEDLYSLTININNNTYPLLQRTFYEMDEQFIASNLYKGRPTDFSIFDEQIRLYPIPDDAYTLTLAYSKSLGDLSTATDSNEWTTTCKDLVRFHAAADLATNKLQDQARGDRFKMQEMSEYNKLRGHHTRRTASGRARKRVM